MFGAPPWKKLLTNVPSIKIFVSAAVPPRTNNLHSLPLAAPGKVFKAPVTSPFALAVVTISIGVKTTPALFRSLASKCSCTDNNCG
jgi:hypothetical protein